MTPILAQGPPHVPPGRGPWDPYHPGQGNPPPFDRPVIPEPSSVTIVLAFLILFLLIRTKRSNMSKNLTSPTHVKRYALDVSISCRAGKFSRVSKQFLDRVEANTRTFVAAQVKAHPSVGKTLF